jgi:hypothetical protein
LFCRVTIFLALQIGTLPFLRENETGTQCSTWLSFMSDHALSLYTYHCWTPCNEYKWKIAIITSNIKLLSWYMIIICTFEVSNRFHHCHSMNTNFCSFRCTACIEMDSLCSLSVNLQLHFGILNKERRKQYVCHNSNYKQPRCLITALLHVLPPSPPSDFHLNHSEWNWIRTTANYDTPGTQSQLQQYELWFRNSKPVHAYNTILIKQKKTGETGTKLQTGRDKVSKPELFQSNRDVW